MYSLLTYMYSPPNAQAWEVNYKSACLVLVILPIVLYNIHSHHGPNLPVPPDGVVCGGDSIGESGVLELLPLLWGSEGGICFARKALNA